MIKKWGFPKEDRNFLNAFKTTTFAAVMNPNRTVAFYTLGCKLNFSETSTIARDMKLDGFGVVEFDSAADCYVINTCSVTDNADKKCRSIVRKALRNNPEAFVVVVGCYAQLKPEEISTIPGVDLVLGANEKFNISSYLDSLEKAKSGRAIYGKIKEVKEFEPSYSQGDRTRSFFKVQDGCDYFCSFCTIPLARGRSRSATVAETMKSAQEVAVSDAREMILTGVNIGDFGKGTSETFFDLVKELDTLNGVDRIRISSIEPNLLSDEIIEFCASSNLFVPHFHIPLQSGSDLLLESMRRKYKTALYRNRIEKIKRLNPDACIGVDVIVGYPGETDEEFEKTYQFLLDLDISYLHVFTYSERDNTTAIRIEDIVPQDVRNERSKRLRILSSKKKRAFYTSQIGKEYTVLWEGEKHEEVLHGFTENYLKASTSYDPNKVNQLQRVKITGINGDGLVDVEVLEVLAEA